jgi:putative Ca2+/H+ antiporter (TMEM165/GDT1 family)
VCVLLAAHHLHAAEHQNGVWLPCTFAEPALLSSSVLACLLLQLSTVIGAAIPEERHEGKWIEGIAIWVAIFLVTFVSEWQRQQCYCQGL